MSKRNAFILGILSTIGAMTLVAFVFIGLAYANYGSKTQTEEQSLVPAKVSYQPATAQEIFTLVNQERGKAGAEPLIPMNELYVSAQYKADDMSNRNYFDHKDPVTGKFNGLDKALEVTNHYCSYLSENIESGGDKYVQAKEVISGWMNSESHRSALLNKKYSYTGIGIAIDSKGTQYVVQHFCQKA